MTAPVAPVKQGTPPHILTGDEWEQAQYAPHRIGVDPASPQGPGRILTGDEWEQAQRAASVHTLTFPSLPKIATDATAVGPKANPDAKSLAPFDIKDPTTYANPLLRQIVNPALDNPLTTAAFGAAFGVPGLVPGALAASPLLEAGAGAVLAGSFVHHAAQYGWQKAAEMQLSPEDRKRAEADPERISGESAAVQAGLLGLGALIHVAVKSVKAAGIERAANEDAAANASFAESLKGGPKARAGALAKVAGLEAEQPATIAVGRRVAPVEGLEVPAAPKIGDVTPVTTEPASVSAETPLTVPGARGPVAPAAPGTLPHGAAASGTGEDFQLTDKPFAQGRGVRRAMADDAERVGKSVTPNASATVPYFESQQGAELLGVRAAQHGLPDDASPYQPGSPLEAAWKQGHDATKASYPLYPEGFAMGGSESRIPPDFTPPKLPKTEPEVLADALTPSRLRGHSLPELDEVIRSARAKIDHANDVLKTEQARDEPDQSVLDAADKQSTHAAQVLKDAERELTLRGLAPEAENAPTFKGPKALYARLSDEALGVQYRHLIDQRATEEPNAIPPIWDEDREARAVEHIESRRRTDGTMAPADKRRLAALQLSQGEGYGEGRHTFESAAAEARVTKMTAHIDAIEREAKLRGLDTDAMLQPHETQPTGGSVGAPRPGMSRLYRTETDLGGNGSEGYRHFTDKLDYAKIYEGDRQSYLDVPTQDLGSKYPGMQAEAGTGATIYRIPNEVASSRAPFSGSDAPMAGRAPIDIDALPPVEGTGETKARGLSVGVEDKAIAHKLTDYLGDLPEYRTINMGDQASRASRLLETDGELARKVALGQAPPPADLLPESVFVAVENKAIADGDVGTLRELAAGKLTEQATTMGQRIRALGERDPESPVGAMRKIVEARTKGIDDPEGAISGAVDELRGHIADAVKIDRGAWQQFIDSLRC